jgi:2-keto-4-pentenoate hydratase/2-oxohepta-3-ene-1,7-dioic acid hydratase in catechol pathway
VVLGYTCGNDVTAREQQSKDGQWARAKSYDTFAPIGPAIVTGIQPGGRRLQTRLNGKIVQEANTDQMMFKVARQIAHISRFMTLLAGDIIFTGTPSGIGPMKAGDVVEVDIEGIGVLRNRCIAE